jgi:hypothetical protein
MLVWLSSSAALEAHCDVSSLEVDSGINFVKTHEMAKADDTPAVVLVRDGCDVAVSFAYYVLKTGHGIENPQRDVFHVARRTAVCCLSCSGSCTRLCRGFSLRKAGIRTGRDDLALAGTFP